ncbi:MAG: hypothetical protein LBG59_02300 [Candidatus Peribacteria bacterium]|nr:hypothetical protein [Candidatus Peribacteria bacterium]
MWAVFDKLNPLRPLSAPDPPPSSLSFLLLQEFPRLLVRCPDFSFHLLAFKPLRLVVFPEVLWSVLLH